MAKPTITTASSQPAPSISNGNEDDINVSIGCAFGDNVAKYVKKKDNHCTPSRPGGSTWGVWLDGCPPAPNPPLTTSRRIKRSKLSSVNDEETFIGE